MMRLRLRTIKSPKDKIFKGDFKKTIKKAEILKLTPFFEVLKKEQIISLTGKVKHKKFEGETLLFREGDGAEELYIICSGEISLYKVLGNGKRKDFVTLSAGDIFGEMGVINSSPRSLSAVISSPSAEAYVISQKDFFYMLCKYPDLAINLAQVLCKRIEETNKRVLEKLEKSHIYIKEKFLRRGRKAHIVKEVPLFSILSEIDIERLSRKIRLKRILAPFILFDEGSPSDYLYIIKSGSVDLYKKSGRPGDIINYITLGRGELFGEMGLLTGSPRCLSARAGTEKVELYVVTKDDFFYMLRKHNDLRLNLIKILCNRIGETNKKLVNVSR